MEYLYRDAGNYKSWGAVVVANAPDPLTLDDIEAIARASLIEGAWFVAAAAGLPDLRGDEWDDELDHDWHELHGFAGTDEPADDPHGRDIRGLLGALAAGAAGAV
jgi:hypothetical protein